MKQWWNIVNWTPGNKLQGDLNRSIFIPENTFGNVVYNMAAILCRPRCVNWLWGRCLWSTQLLRANGVKTRAGVATMAHTSCCIMTSSNGNIFRVTGPLGGEFTGHRWIPRTKASDAEAWCFFGLCLNKRLSKLSWVWWFKTPSRSLWRYCNVMEIRWAFLPPSSRYNCNRADDIKLAA